MKYRCFGCDTNSKSNKRKIKQLGLHQTKKLLHGKAKPSTKRKGNLGMGENIYL